MTSLTKKALLLAAVAALVSLCVAAYWQQWPPSFWKPAPEANLLTLSGNIEAHESVLSFKSVQSRIIELPFNEGQWVRAGTVLAVVDSADYQQQIAIAQGSLDVQKRQLDASQQNLETAGRTLLLDQTEQKQRQRDYQRALDLQKQGFTSAATLDQAETALQQTKAMLARDESLQSAASRNVAVAQAAVHGAAQTLALARIVLGYTSLMAPFDGVVTVRQSEIGEVVVPGTPVLTLADLDHVWLRAYINETDLGRIRIGQAVTVSTDSHRDKQFQGRIAFIAEKAEFTPKSVETHVERVNLVYRVKIDIANPNHALLPGMPADAKVELQAAGT